MNTCWEPSNDRIEKAELTKFIAWLAINKGVEVNDYDELYNWSIDSSLEFWSVCIEYFEVIFEGDLETNAESLKFLDYNWFPNAKLNFAQNLLEKGEPAATALHFFHESGIEKKWSYSELKTDVSKLSNYLSEIIEEGDVVAAYMPNVAETVIGMLATTVLGGVFTSTSCDFGVGGVVDRFGQSRPKVLIAATRYTYNGKEFDQIDKIREIVNKVDSIEKVVLVDFIGNNVPNIEKGISYSEIQSTSVNKPLEYKLRSFGDPLYIMYSSGTTGTPKCIVHGVGGTLVQHLKELSFHSNLNADKSILYFTTCGWMMWNWLVSSLALGSRVGLYEGSPAAPTLTDFVEIVDKGGFELWGTSPKFLKALENSGYDNDFEFKKLEAILSTGAPLLPEQFDFIYNKFKSDVQLSSISGGTDILGCFMLGNPLKPVYRGEIQTRGLGMAVASLDGNKNPILDTEGELACLKSFPSQPIYFLNDNNQERYRSAYFETFGEHIWHHGDFITLTSKGSVIVHGRSDSTLNPGGIRIGTAEIYRQVELVNEVEDSLCVGKSENGDVSVVLFVKLKDSMSELSDELIGKIKKMIRSKTTSRHVPKYIFNVSGIPYTRSGKKMELVISRLINGRSITNRDAVANPECLDQYEKTFN